jgi:hypothetical protein
MDEVIEIAHIGSIGTKYYILYFWLKEGEGFL